MNHMASMFLCIRVCLSIYLYLYLYVCMCDRIISNKVIFALLVSNHQYGSSQMCPLLSIHVVLSEAPRFRISLFWTVDRVFPHRSFSHCAFQHHAMQKINPRHTLTLTQPKIYYSCLAAARVKRTWRPSQPIGQAHVRRCIHSVIHHSTAPYHPNVCRSFITNLVDN